MMYTVKYSEKFSRTFLVEAEDYDEAINKVYDAADKSFIMLTEIDYEEGSDKIEYCELSKDKDFMLYDDLDTYMYYGNTYKDDVDRWLDEL